MSQFKQVVEADQRLTILRVLNEDAAYSHNEFVLQESLALCGHKISKDKLKTELHWLQEQSLITLSDGGVLVAKLTERGADVATGCAEQPGVKRPRPGG